MDFLNENKLNSIEKGKRFRLGLFLKIYLVNLFMYGDKKVFNMFVLNVKFIYWIRFVKDMWFVYYVCKFNVICYFVFKVLNISYRWKMEGVKCWIFKFMLLILSIFVIFVRMFFIFFCYCMREFFCFFLIFLWIKNCWSFNKFYKKV